MPYNAIILTDTESLLRIRPLGAYSVANSLRDNRFSVLVIDYFSRIPRKELLFLLKKFISDQTFFLGYSSSLFLNKNTGDYFLISPEEIFSINNFVKDLNPKIKIIFGGANSKNLVTYNFRTKNNLGFDFAMHGYSDRMIVDFVENMKSDKPVKFSNVFNNLYEIDYDYKGELFNFKDSRFSWHKNDLIFRGESLPLELARGCIFKCKFCAYPLLGKNPKDSSYLKSEKNLYIELKENYEKYNTVNYIIVDDTFNERIEKMEMLLRVRDKLKLNLTFSGYNRIDLIARKPQQLSLLKDLNFKGLFFGIESLNYASAKSIGKGLRPEECIETLYKIKDFFQSQVSITGGFIVGLPYETPETFSKWLEVIIQKDFPIDTIGFYALSITNSTHTDSEFNKNPTKYGYAILPSGFWKNDFWDQHNCINIVNKLNEQLVKSGRQKIGALSAAGVASLGYDFDNLINMSAKDLDMAEIKISSNKRISYYVNLLKSLPD